MTLTERLKNVTGDERSKLIRNIFDEAFVDESIDINLEISSTYDNVLNHYLDQNLINDVLDTKKYLNKLPLSPEVIIEVYKGQKYMKDGFNTFYNALSDIHTAMYFDIGLNDVKQRRNLPSEMNGDNFHTTVQYVLMRGILRSKQISMFSPKAEKIVEEDIGIIRKTPISAYHTSI